MAKIKNFYTCISCGHNEPKWLGRCPECGEWNSFKEAAEKKTGRNSSVKISKSLPLSIIEINNDFRIDSGIEEINRVLGGGIIRESSILVGGEPGIGKSTLMLQIASCLKSSGKVLYISGEESAGQIKMRAERLKINKEIEILCETEIEQIMTSLETLKPVLIIMDSIQTLLSYELGSVPGTVNQIKYCCHELVSWVKEHSSAIFLVAHITKEGIIAGPKIIEHMVDSVLYFDQKNTDIRILRATKNRFGSTAEIALFTMQETGLIQVKDPSTLFMVQRNGTLPAGISCAPVYEGSRVLLVEIQALVVPVKGAISRIFSDKIDSRRVSRVAAVLEKHLSLRFSDQDIYINIAGGIRIDEVGIELPLALALYSARTDISIPSKTAVAGEISLAGEIRPIPHLPERIKAALNMGFPRFIGPDSGEIKIIKGCNFTGIKTIKQGIKTVFSPQ